jgi:hypothetical protein
MSTETTNMLQLPVAVGLDGTESVWVIQGGTDKRTTAGALAVGGDIQANAPVLLAEPYGFLLSGRVLTGTPDVVVLTDNGVGTTFVISLNGPGVAQLVSEPRTVTAAGNVTVADDDLAIYMRQTVAAAVDILLPAAADKVGPVYISDANGVAAANNFRIVPNGAETIVGLSEYLINVDYMSLNLRPVSGVGWLL